MGKRLIVHLGPRKTGSTTIQSMLTLNADRLAPRIEVHARDRLFRRWRHRARDCARGGTPLDAPVVQAEARKVAEVLRDSPAEIIVISDENLAGSIVGHGARSVWHFLGETIAAVEQAFADFDRHYVIYRRDEEKWLRSCYNQDVKNKGCALPYDAWRAQYAADLGRDAALEAIGAQVGDRLDVITMEEESANAPVLGAAVLAVAGLTEAQIAEMETPPRENESLPPELLETVRALNARWLPRWYRRRLIARASAALKGPGQ